MNEVIIKQYVSQAVKEVEEQNSENKLSDGEEIGKAGKKA